MRSGCPRSARPARESDAARGRVGSRPPAGLPGDLRAGGRAHKVKEHDAGWSSSVARWAHNPEVAGSNPAPATKLVQVRGPSAEDGGRAFCMMAAWWQQDRAVASAGP